VATSQSTARVASSSAAGPADLVVTAGAGTSGSPAAASAAGFPSPARRRA
jgi:hypothetical protein